MAEQFRSDYLDRAENQLSPAGFRRLIESGSFYPDCRFYSSTFSASGLATLSTGAYPQTHGIVAESWYDREGRKVRPANAAACEATLLASQIGEADRRNRVYGAGMNDIHTELAAGPSAVELFSMDSNGQVVSRKATPAWLAAFQRKQAPEKQRDANWLAVGAKPGSAALRILHYNAARPEEFGALYRASPYSQAAQFDLARELIVQEKLGQRDGLDFLVVILGSMASLGYEVGADSQLMQQMVLHLDRQVETTLEMLNRAIGAGNYTFAFTGAHGAPPEPEMRARGQMAIDGAKVAAAVDRGLSDRYDIAGSRNRYVQRYLYPFLYLRLEQLRRFDINLREARAAAGQAALRVPGVAGYYTADGDCSHTGEWLRRFQNSFHAIRSGDVMLSYLPEYVEEYGSGRGISYGSLYNYDARVPLLFYGPQFQAETFETAVEAVDIAPTLARAMGVSPPSSSTGRVLAEAFAFNVKR